MLPTLVYDSSWISRFPVQYSVVFHSLDRVFFLYPALLLLQLTGQSDANSPGETAGKHHFKKRLGMSLYEPKEISRKTSEVKTVRGTLSSLRCGKAGWAPSKTGMCIDENNHPTSFCCRRLCLHLQLSLDLHPKATQQGLGRGAGEQLCIFFLSEEGSSQWPNG